MGRSLYESVAHLEGLPMLEDLKPKVVFDWRPFDKSRAMVDTMGPPLRECALLRLPRWMQFEIVISPESSWFTRGVVERWLDGYCPNERTRARVWVRETSRRGVRMEEA